MEPVPETERMEEFRSSPVPALYVSKPNNSSSGKITSNTSLSFDLDALKKPPTIRRSTDPSPTSTSALLWSPSSATIPYRPRTASPLAGGHTRSRSVASIAPAMSRTQSLPTVIGSGHILHSPLMRPVSPAGSQSPSRTRVPRKPSDEAFPPSSPVRTSVLDLDRGQGKRSNSPGLSVVHPSGRLRRPSSPMRSVPPPSNVGLANIPSTPSSISSSPSYRAVDAVYSNYGGNLSSIPSTPTSARSRSPSISSLETIPDSPDAEEAALEEERAEQTKAAELALEGGESGDGKGKGALDVPSRGRTLAYGSSRDKRKRWSVCGAERRQDLDLETIWED